MCNDDKMSLTHGTGVQKRDALWVLENRIGIVFSIMFAFISIAIFVYFVYDRDGLFSYLISALLLCASFMGFQEATWRNSTYLVTDDCLQLCFARRTENTSWDLITGYGVYPVLMLAYLAPRPYIVLMKSHSEYRYPSNIRNCFNARKRIIIIRYTEERLREIAEQMDKRGIPMDPRDERHPPEEIDDRNALR